MAATVRRRVATAEKEPDEGSGSKAMRRREERSALQALTLPSEVSTPAAELSAYTMLVYGLQKIGKTTLCARFPKAFFLMCEPGGRALAIYQRKVGSWKEYLRYLELLEEGSEYATLVIDTVDMLYGFCYDYCCEKHAVEHPSEIAYGVVWSDLRKEFTRGLVRAMQLPMGVILVSHEVEKEIRRKSGESSHQITSSLPTMAREIVESLVDIAAHYQYVGGARQLCLSGDDQVVAGCRLEEHFVKTKQIPMGNSADEAYQNFMAAYNNKAVSSGEEAAQSTETNKPVRRVRR